MNHCKHQSGLSTTQGSVAFIDCTFGASGDMLLAAMLDLGFPLEELEAAVRCLGTEGWSLKTEKTARRGLRATRLIVETDEDAPERTWREIRSTIENSSLDDGIKQSALAVFRRLAETEAGIHGVDVEKVHFHELSGLDAIIDIVGAAAAFKWLGAGKIVCSPVNLGSGTVQCRHGILPVPAPATAELIKGAAVFSSGQGELTTPTGALLLTQFASSFGPMPIIKVSKTGYGAGTFDFPSHPNILRIFTGEALPSDMCSEQMLILQTNIDDMNPQVFPWLIEKMLSAGALDVWLENAIMKKGRPATVVNILCDREKIAALFEILLAETTTLGARIITAERLCIARVMESVETEFGRISVKIGVAGGKIANVMPEYEDCAAAARSTGATLSAVMEAAKSAAAAKWKRGDSV